MRRNNYKFFEIFPIKSANSEERLQFSLLTLMQKKPYEEISVTELCEYTGISRKTFYKYFNSKEELLSFIASNLILGYQEFHFTPPKGITDDSFIGLLNYFTYWYYMQDWVRVLIDNNLWASVSTLKSDILETLRPRNWGDFLEKDSERLKMTLEFINAGLANLVEIWARHGFDKSPEQMAETAYYILKGEMVQQIKLL